MTNTENPIDAAADTAVDSAVGTSADTSAQHRGAGGSAAAALTGERAAIQSLLAKSRHFLKFTARELTDDQARQRSTVSELTIGGLIKHVTETEDGWARFIVEGAPAMLKNGKDWTEWTEQDWAERADSFVLLPHETLAGVLAEYDAVAARTDALVATADLDLAHRLPDAPWNEPGKHQSARESLLHVATETAQHSGHADIIREAIDGAKSMG